LTTEPVDIEAELFKLEAKIVALTAACDRLREENRSLRERQQEWVRERASLMERTAIAKNRVEAMISRLKSMGHES
jgi:cell division protein ZapB